MFSSVLIANRGEIAVRIIRACRELGLRTIAVYSDADAGALHVRLADEAVLLGPAPVRESYLNMDGILAAAAQTGAEAIHPGYGMLSENAEFAQRVLDAGLVFVGPSPEVIARMGDKTEARSEALRCGLPVLPGSDGAVSSTAEAMRLAEGIGFPLLVKAAFGGGGRGMRKADTLSELNDALAEAGRESGLAFGRTEVFLERFLDRPRHVEVQILADQHGQVVHLGDRDCTVQRRHQKLMEEAPAPGLPDALRARLQDAAVRLAKGIGYTGAGTVEFLYDPAAQAFHFLEMNTRLQVEHGVTEMVTGIDLVAAQLKVAAGLPLELSQDQIQISGHAIQARIAAEDPWQGFRPTPGRITRLALPSGPGLRLDFGVEAGDSIPQHYDSMFGKIHAHGADRAIACQRLSLALGEFAAEGVATTAPFLRQVLQSEDFLHMRHDTGSVGRDWVPDPAQAPVQSVAQAPATERWVSISTDRGAVDIVIPLPRADAASGQPSTRKDRAEPGKSAGMRAMGQPSAPMDSVVTRVEVSVGAHVTRGSIIAVLEAMKMEMPVRAETDLVIEDVLVLPGQAVKLGDALVRARPA
jgi:acetyl-CoA/propionyl-CoA carboxylase, biotin carboxylase, biotin carboxyl carrier protein